jgi:hypothetical protein
MRVTLNDDTILECAVDGAIVVQPITLARGEDGKLQPTSVALPRTARGYTRSLLASQALDARATGSREVLLLWAIEPDPEAQ